MGHLKSKLRSTITANQRRMLKCFLVDFGNSLKTFGSYYTKLVSSSYIYLLALTPAFRPRFRGWPPCFMKKFSFSDCSVWPGKCRPMSAQVSSSWTILANRISCSVVSSLPGFRFDTTRRETVAFASNSLETEPKTSEWSERWKWLEVRGNANSRLYIV